MKNLLLRWLGIESYFTCIHTHLADLHDEMIGMRSDLSMIFHDEHDPKRAEMSAKLGARAIKRLQGEDLARKHTLGEL